MLSCRVPADLLDVLAAAAVADSPGQALLRASQAAAWPVLALLAACHGDAPVLCCLAVWLRCTLFRSRGTPPSNLLSTHTILTVTVSACTSRRDVPAIFSIYRT